MDATYAYTPSILPMLVSMLLPVALGLYAWRHRTVPGATWFAVREALIALWALFAGIEIAATTESAKILWFKLETVVTVFVILTVLFFALEYANAVKWLTGRNVLCLSVLPLLTIGLMVTNDLHHLMWTRLWFDAFVRMQRGPLNVPLLICILLFMLLAIFIFLRLSIQSTGIYRWQALLLFVATTLPFLAFLLKPAGINPVALLDPVILISNVGGLMMLLAIYRFGMFGIVPIGRDTAIERMADGVMILNSEHQIVDLNPAARQVLMLSRNAVGQLARQVLPNHPDLIRLIEQETSANAEVAMERENQTHCYQMRISALVDPRGFKLGRLLLFHDITDQKRAQHQLVEQQRVMATLEERERLARELHDTLVQQTAAIRMQAETTDQLVAQGETAMVHANLALIADTAHDMHLDLREYLFGVASLIKANQNFFVDLRAYLTHFDQRWAIQTQLHVPTELEQQGLGALVESQLWRIVQEALTNVRKYASAHCVEILFERNNAHIQVVIQDDGCGFDVAQLSTRNARGFGTRAMRDRARSIGGTFQLHSAPGEGTRVVVKVPWDK